MSSKLLNPMHIMNMVDDCIKNTSPIHALVLLLCASNLYRIRSNRDDGVCGIGDCSYKAQVAISQLIKQGGKRKAISGAFGLQVFRDILSDLRSSPAEHSRVKAIQEARCLNNMGMSYGAIGYFPKEINFYEEGIHLLKKTFGIDAIRYRILGDLRNNLGVALTELGKYSEAKKFFVGACGAFEKAEDLYEDGKELLMNRADSNLQQVQNKLQSLPVCNGDKDRLHQVTNTNLYTSCDDIRKSPLFSSSV
ncbi:uncharacterized protein LOC120338942 [Styela clava]